jgi:hypothetical protein
VHAVESLLAESGGAPDAAQRARVAAAWARFRAGVTALLDRDASVLPLPRAEYGRVLSAARSGVPAEWIADQMVAWTWDDAEARLHHLGDAAAALATRLGRAPLRVRVDAAGVRASPAMAPLWTSLSHVVRNAVDHGVERAEEREAAGKAPGGTLVLTARLGAHLRIEIADDGAGVAWDRLRAKAAARGLPHATHDDLVQAMFADGVSSRDEATEVSGRGVGMGAVRALVEALGGVVRVGSEPGRGTTIALELPRRLALDLAASPRADEAPLHAIA